MFVTIAGGHRLEALSNPHKADLRGLPVLCPRNIFYNFYVQNGRITVRRSREGGNSGALKLDSRLHGGDNSFVAYLEDSTPGRLRSGIQTKEPDFGTRLRKNTKRA